jgi:hypothetical protein
LRRGQWKLTGPGTLTDTVLDPGQTAALSTVPESVEQTGFDGNKKERTSDLSAVGRSPLILKQSAPIQIDLSSLKNSGQFVDLPGRPGDVVIVPASGEVMVQGWVMKPGAFKITSGMTALGAVTAAGGEQFSSSATVLRTAEDGDKVEIPINLGRIKAGKERDVPVQSGDVVIVNRSAVGAVPYFLSTLFNKFGTGAYVPIP